MLTVGAGGAGTEHLGDVSHRVLPVAPEEILEMLGELRMSPVLGGTRGRPMIDYASVVKLASALARHVVEDPSIVEL